jgi:para-aminobenzoate synthetase/4-amino-4-deoxychorismate lyase
MFMDTIRPQANEILLKENAGWRYFMNPHRIIQAKRLHEVLPALREIEELTEQKKWHAAGFLSYESAPAFDEAYHVGRNRSMDMAREVEFPLLWFGLYPAPRLIADLKPASTTPALSWLPTVDQDTYNAAITQIKNRIAQGRTYQVNYTMRLRSDFNSDAWEFFLHLAQTQNNHAAYVDTGRFVIASASPELFFQLDGETVTCRPMKGTTRRGRTTREDREQAQWLHESEKNRAENVMIVDMIRNELGRIAKIGSVNVPELFTVEKYPTLWQMTSTVQAQTSASLTRIMSALFPCASITGAPKISTMRIISELETSPRKIYTGSIGHIAPNRKATFNVAIRTALIDRKTQIAEYGVGGGIVWDSTSADEYAEALLKARVLAERVPDFSLIETMLWTPGEGFYLREKHIARLLDSAEYFGFAISPNPRWSSNPNASEGVSRISAARETIATYLNDISSQFTSPHRVRVSLDKHGNLSYESAPFESSGNTPSLKVCLAKESVDPADVFLFHKTTQRAIFEKAHANFSDYDDVLLYNERGEATEFTIGNLVVEMDGRFYTPPIVCGVLPGTFRAHLLETGQVEERLIQVEEVWGCAGIFRVNSVRKWQRVTLVTAPLR